MTERETLLTNILRQIIAKTDDGPGACMGREGDGVMTWKGSFRSPLWDASNAIGSQPVADTSAEVGFGDRDIISR